MPSAQPKTNANQLKRVKLLSPLGGVVRSVAREQQRTETGPQGELPTCWDALNVRPYDQYGRSRVAQRPGIGKAFWPQLGGGEPIQSLTPVNFVNYQPGPFSDSYPSLTPGPEVVPSVANNESGTIGPGIIPFSLFKFPLFVPFVATLTTTQAFETSPTVQFDVSAWNTDDLGGDPTTPSQSLYIQQVASGASILEIQTYGPLIYAISGGAPTVTFTPSAGTLNAIITTAIPDVGGLYGITITANTTHGLSPNTFYTFLASATNGGGGPISTTTLTFGGSGYTNTPIVQISGGGGGLSASIGCNIAGGSVTGITINDSGYGYTSTPTLTFINQGSDTTTITATATCTIDHGVQAIFAAHTNSTGTVTLVEISNPGDGYTANGTFNFNAALYGGTGAVSGTATNSQEVAYTLVNGGLYTAIPTVTSTGGTLVEGNTTLYTVPSAGEGSLSYSTSITADNSTTVVNLNSTSNPSIVYGAFAFLNQFPFVTWNVFLSTTKAGLWTDLQNIAELNIQSIINNDYVPNTTDLLLNSVAPPAIPIACAGNSNGSATFAPLTFP
jgi:hypothetical protein